MPFSRLSVIAFCVCGSAAAADTIVALDMAFASNAGVPLVFDHFADGVLGPQWIVLTGAPGPESGTVLELRPGDFMIAPMNTDPAFATLAVASMNLTEFPAGSAVIMLLTGEQPGDILAFIITPDLALLFDEQGILGGIPLDVGATALPLMFIDGSGNLAAFINGEVAFFGANTLGRVTGLGFGVIPEPATVAFLGLGLLSLGVRGRRFRG